MRQPASTCLGEKGKSGTQGGKPLTAALTPQAIGTILTNGRNAMPAFGSTMSEPDLEDLIAYVMKLVGKSVKPHRSHDAMALHTDEFHPHVHAVLQAVSEQGERLYIRKATLARSPHCHIDELRLGERTLDVADLAPVSYLA